MVVCQFFGYLKFISLKELEIQSDIETIGSGSRSHEVFKTSSSFTTTHLSGCFWVKTKFFGFGTSGKNGEISSEGGDCDVLQFADAKGVSQR